MLCCRVVVEERAMEETNHKRQEDCLYTGWWQRLALWPCRMKLGKVMWGPLCRETEVQPRVSGSVPVPCDLGFHGRGMGHGDSEHRGHHVEQFCCHEACVMAASNKVSLAAHKLRQAQACTLPSVTSSQKQFITRGQ